MHITHAYTEEQKMGNIDAARKLLYFALERDPNDGLIYQSLALIEQNEGRIVEARRLLEEGVTRDQTNVFLWSARGVFESRQGRLQRRVKLCFGRIVGSQKFFGGKVNVDKKDIKIFRNDTETENGNVVVVHVGRCKAGANFKKEALLPLYIVNVLGTDLESLTGSKITSKKSKRIQQVVRFPIDVLGDFG